MLTWKFLDNPVPCMLQRTTNNSLWPSESIWRHRSRSTLVQVMAFCLMAPSHYLNQCWLIIRKVLLHSAEGNFTGNVPDSYHWYDFENDKFKFRAVSPRGLWVKIKYLSDFCSFGSWYWLHIVTHSFIAHVCGHVGFILLAWDRLHSNITGNMVTCQVKIDHEDIT